MLPLICFYDFFDVVVDFLISVVNVFVINYEFMFIIFFIRKQYICTYYIISLKFMNMLFVPEG